MYFRLSVYVAAIIVIDFIVLLQFGFASVSHPKSSDKRGDKLA